MKVLKVTISARAEKNLDDLVEYLESKWPAKVKKEFLKKLLNSVTLISKNPYLFPASEKKKEIRKCILTKHNSMYYRVMKDEIEIITIQDNRRNPDDLKL